MTLGIHLVWTTYGTWLPGDDRGHWSPLFTLYGTIRERGGRLNQPDETTRTKVLERMTEPPKVLDAEEEAVVAAEIGQHVQPHCVAIAAAVERTHVHLLIGPLQEDVSRFTGRLKGTSSSAVGLLPKNRDRRRVWGDGFWKVFLFDDIGVSAVRAYIEDHNVRRGSPAKRFNWVI